MKYNLLLDDIRNPIDVWNITHNLIYIDKKWIVVRNYEQFVNIVTHNFLEYEVLPEILSMDHDLSDKHYRPSMYDPNIEHYSKYYTDGTFKEKTGYDCAKWLVDFCMDNKLEIPKYFVHSMNPVGKDNIIALLEKFKKYQNEKEK